MSNKPVKIMETVLRDGHQSLAATRMRTSDMIEMLEKLDDLDIKKIVKERKSEKSIRVSLDAL